MAIELRVWVDDGSIPAGRDEQVIQKLRDHRMTYQEAVDVLPGLVATSAAEHAEDGGVGAVRGSIWPCQCADCMRPHGQPNKPPRSYTVTWSYDTHADSAEAAVRLASAVMLTEDHGGHLDFEVHWQEDGKERGQDVTLPHATPDATGED